MCIYKRHTLLIYKKCDIFGEHCTCAPVYICKKKKFMTLQCTRIHPYLMPTFTSLHSLRLEFSTHFCRAMKKGTSVFTYLLSITDASLHESLGKLMRFYLT